MDLENLKHANDEREKILTALETQLKNENYGQHGQETPPFGNVDKDPIDIDATIHVASNDDNTNENFNTTGNANGERVNGPPTTVNSKHCNLI